MCSLKFEPDGKFRLLQRYWSYTDEKKINQEIHKVCVRVCCTTQEILPKNKIIIQQYNRIVQRSISFIYAIALRPTTQIYSIFLIYLFLPENPDLEVSPRAVSSFISYIWFFSSSGIVCSPSPRHIYVYIIVIFAVCSRRQLWFGPAPKTV